MEGQLIYTEQNNCQDCYKCVRECPVKAIRVEDHRASVIGKNCIYCGHCTTTCPVEAKKVRHDLDRIRFLIQNHPRVIASIAPAYIAEFSDIKKTELVAMLQELGFWKVSETAIGAEMVTAETANYFAAQTQGVHISPCCPVVVELVRKYYPQHADKIVPFDTPMLSHGRMLKAKYGADVKVVFIGPCIAKKKEAEENSGLIDAALTFKSLHNWFASEKITSDDVSGVEANFEPQVAGDASLYPIEGGMISGMKRTTPIDDEACMTFSGLNSVKNILEELDGLPADNKLFLELLACKGGCVNGPGAKEKNSLIGKRQLVINDHKFRPNYITTSTASATFINRYDYIQPIIENNYSPDMVEEVLHSVGKFCPDDELDCGGCGYQSCRDFAKAILDEKAERTMCVSYMRKVAQDKASVLLHRMPYGVVMVDENLKIVESNKAFAQLLGEDVELAYDVKPGLWGADLRKVLPWHAFFEKLISSGVEQMERDVKMESKMYNLSVFTIQKDRIYCGILRNLGMPELKRDEIIRRTREVIQENLSTVQQIAFLLGENASKTETILNSIVNMQYQDDDTNIDL